MRFWPYSKVFHVGGMMHLDNRRDISEAENNKRSGWPSKSNSSSYVHPNLSMNMPGARALAGWPDAHQMTYPPSWEECNDPELIFQFIHMLFPVTIPEFREDGVLFNWLMVSGASLVPYHFKLIKDFGTKNAIVQQVSFATNQGGVSSNLLLEWLQQINKRFKEKINMHFWMTLMCKMFFINKQRFC